MKLQDLLCFLFLLNGMFRTNLDFTVSYGTMCNFCKTSFYFFFFLHKNKRQQMVALLKRILQLLIASIVILGNFTYKRQKLLQCLLRVFAVTFSRRRQILFVWPKWVSFSAEVKTSRVRRNNTKKCSNNIALPNCHQQQRNLT